MVSAEIVKEIIKPSSPTPHHLKKLNLSFLDQLAPPIYIHIILYYENPRNPLQSHVDSSFETSRLVKQSLADALAIYYPLAGRIRDNSWVDCNDEGVEYFEARFNHKRLWDIVENPCMDELKQYVPAVPGGGCDIPLAVQVSFFGCGGWAVGVCVSHKVADAKSMVMFINAWAAICRGDVKTVAFTQPSFDLVSRFPQADFSGFFPTGTPSPSPPPPPEKIVTKRFMFNEQKLAILRKAAAGSLLENPTRVEAVSAFIWRHKIQAASLKHKAHAHGVNLTFAATHAVDIRRRASPPLHHLFFGNACARAMATATPSSKGDDYYALATKLRDAIRKADGDYVRLLENSDSFLKYYSNNEENDPSFRDGRKKIEICGFSSWCRFPAYDADYGYGKPVWVSIIPVPQKNLIFLLGTKNGDGIEAWVNMLDEDMANIETNYHLLDQIVKMEQKLKFEGGK